MSLNTSFSKIGIFLGLGLGSVAVLSAGMGAVLIGKVLESENRAYIQQSIGDTTIILANYFRSEFKNISDRIVETGKVQLSPKILPSVSELAPGMDTIETDPDIIDITLWRKGQLQGAADRHLPKPYFFAINSKYKDSSPQLLNQVHASTQVDQHFIQPAFQGRIVVRLTPTAFSHKNIALIAVPLNSSREEVAVAHLRLERFQQAFHSESMAFASLVDDAGNVLAKQNSNESTFGEKVKGTPLFQTMHSSTLTSGQLNYTDHEGVNFYGGYSRLGIGQLSILANVSETEAGDSLKILKKQTLFFLLICFCSFFGIGYALSANLNIQLNGLSTTPAPTALPPVEAKDELENPAVQAPQRVNVTVVFGSLKYLNQLLEIEEPQSATDSINEFFTIAASTVKAYGGLFQISGKAFIAVWGAPQSEGTEVWRAIRCALDLRQNISKLNEARKVDGQKKIFYGIGIHSGLALAARLGEVKHLKYQVLGEVVNIAQSLNQLCQVSQLDLLISQEIWQQSEAKFMGELMGEAKLTSHSGLNHYYSISGYRNEQGEEVIVEYSKESAPLEFNGRAEETGVEIISKEKKNNRWLVNNGSQIIGPLTAPEIASRLFAQELDFDCECWLEGLGNSAQIKNAGIFSGSEDQGAGLWVYDGETIHGPINSGFLKTAIGHGAIPKSGYICEETTVNGWTPLLNWDLDRVPLKEVEQDFMKISLSASITPPPQVQDSPAENEVSVSEAPAPEIPIVENPPVSSSSIETSTSETPSAENLNGESTTPSIPLADIQSEPVFTFSPSVSRVEQLNDEPSIDSDSINTNEQVQELPLKKVV